MRRVKLCSECGVPLAVSREQTWHDNGVITQTADPEHRMLFSESGVLDLLFEGIERIIGVPIEHIVVESKRREVREYVEKMVSPLQRRLARRLGTGLMVSRLSKTGRTYGYGDVSFIERRMENGGGDFITMGIRNPHSLAFFKGETMGAWEAIDGREHEVKSVRTGDNEFRVTAHVGKHPVELDKRLLVKSYPFKPGDLRFERCRTCGVPLAVARYTWNLADGTIINPDNGMRTAIFGPRGLEAILDDLEAELGDAIPGAVIEAGRLAIKQEAGDVRLNRSPTSIREILAVRGLGNITAFRPGNGRLEITIENSCVVLVTLGMLQGLYELAGGHESSSLKWSAAPEGTLDLALESMTKAR